MPPLEPEDLEDAQEAIRAARADAAAFTFKYVAYPRLGCATGDPMAEVIATNTATGKARMYSVVGRRASWTAEFAEDLKRGVYGK